MLTAKQHELIRFIQQRLEETGISPSFEEMKEALDLKSKSGVHRLISALEERGFIRRLANRARALEVIKMPEDATPVGRSAAASDPVARVTSPAPLAPQPANDIIEVPLHGRIAAGAPIEALEGQSSMPVPAALLGPGDHYALEVSGDSMIEAGIFDGDYALVKRADSARDGEIVVALVRNEEATLKYLHRD
ncbi:MAG: transcriptional repressor LexA, partial [Altererythrobacter ishigakiensis]|nr:transcriptional repressor LexA [Altererythrobacter ishigakiensis]